MLRRCVLVAMLVPVLIGAGSVARAVPPRGDLLVRTVDVSGLAWECGNGHAAGTVAATLGWLGNEPPTVAPRVVVFEDVDRSGAFEAAVDQRLCDVISPAFGIGTPDVVATCVVSADMAFSGAHVSVVVDANAVVPELDEENNVGHSGWSRQVTPPAIDYELHLRYDEDCEAEAMSSPIVAQVTDDDGNGRVDEHDDVDVLWVKWLTDGQMQGGTIRLHDGRTGAFIAATPATATEGGVPQLVVSSMPPAVGDLDGDGRPEIIGASLDMMHLLCFQFDDATDAFTLKWVSTTRSLRGRPDNVGRIALANLDMQGHAEIVIGACVYSSSGRFLGDGTTLANPGYAGHGHATENWGDFTSVADLDEDGLPEIVAGASAYRFRGGRLSLWWKREDLGDGVTAVSDLNADGSADILLWQHRGFPCDHMPLGRFRVLEADGSDASWWAPPSGGWVTKSGCFGGQPGIADVDGDGYGEIVLLTGDVAVYEHDGTLKWDESINDPSAMCSPAMFDFDADGASEVVIRDSYTVRIFDGSTGSTLADSLFGIGPGSLPGLVAPDGTACVTAPTGEILSGTGWEHPVIADLDADGHAEIVVIAGRWWLTTPDGLQGLIVLENPTWAAALGHWNDEAWHVTAVRGDNSIPRRAISRWRVNPPGDVLRQVAPEDNPFPGPDLTVSRATVSEGPCGDDRVITVRVGNGGATVARDIVVAAYADGATTALATESVPRLDAGAWTEVAFNAEAMEVGSLRVVVDDGDLTDETDETNNECTTPVDRGCPPPLAPTEPHLRITMDPLSGNYHDPVELRATLLSSPPDVPPSVAIEGVFVRFVLGEHECADVTDEDGLARCWITPDAAGTLTLTATADASPAWLSTEDEAEFLVTPEQVSLFFDAPLVQPAWDLQATASAVLREDGALPLEGQEITFENGTTTDIDDVETNGAGAASRTLDVIWGANVVEARVEASATHEERATEVSLHALAPQLMLTPMAQLVDAGGTASLTATLLFDGSERADRDLRVQVIDGPNEASSPDVDNTSTGSTVDCGYSVGSVAGTDTVRVWYEVDGDDEWEAGEPFAEATVQVLPRIATTLSLASASASDYTDVSTVTVKLVETTGSVEIEGAALELDLAGAPCRGITDSAGELTCRVTPITPGPLTLSAMFTGDPAHAPSSDDWEHDYDPEQTTIVVTGYSSTLVGFGRQFTFTARLRADGALALAGEDVVFTINGTPSAPQTTNSIGEATYVVTLTPPGPHTIDASHPATDEYGASTAT